MLFKGGTKKQGNHVEKNVGGRTRDPDKSKMYFYLMGFPPPVPDFLNPVSAEGRFVSDRGTPVSFIEDGAGRSKYVYVGRIYRRTGA